MAEGGTAASQSGGFLGSFQRVPSDLLKSVYIRTVPEEEWMPMLDPGFKFLGEGSFLGLQRV